MYLAKNIPGHSQQPARAPKGGWVEHEKIDNNRTTKKKKRIKREGVKKTFARREIENEQKKKVWSGAKGRYCYLYGGPLK